MPESTGTYDTIASFKITTNTQSISFSNIPQNYQTLVLSINGNYTNSGQSYLRFTPNGFLFNQYQRNSYSLSIMTPSNSLSFSNSNYTTQGFANITPDQGTISLSTEMTCANYNSNAAWKTVIFDSRSQSTVGGYSGLGLSTVESEFPLYNFTLNFDAGTFTAGTSFALYGLSTHQLRATGGDIISSDGQYWYHAFTSSGTFTPVSTLTCDILTVAGGGGGGYNEAGGGGAGGVVFSTSQSISAASSITVGAGGPGGTSNTINGWTGSNSQFASLTAAVGGGGGGSRLGENGGFAGGTGNGANPSVGGNGGSGGGGGIARGGGSATAGQGNAGAAGGDLAGGNGGGGGGGAGAVGVIGYRTVATSTAGNGGAGVNTYSAMLNYLNLGSGGFIAGGGAGSISDVGGGGDQASGGSGGGGGSGILGPGGYGVRNTGSGGGAGRNGGYGGSGLVIVRYAV
jgi:hypothetical protein